MTQPLTPNLEKQQSIKEEASIISQFLEWLEEKEIFFCHENSGPMIGQEEGLMAEYFDIDLKEAEKERTALLEYVRETNKDL